MRFPRLAVLAATALALGAAGCASLGRQAFQNPVVELHDVVVKGVGLQGGSLDVILEVANPNDYRIDASRVTYTLFADSIQVATGEVTKLVTLDNKKTTEVTLPVTFTFRELQKAAQILLARGSVNYMVKGDFTLKTPFGSVTRPYVGKGRYDSLGR
ncbi:MAG: LEA/WHy family protein [Gemmatimonadaceae bacterium]